ncbi:MAG: lipopolysaccharide biosynthesis protein, partial [Pseudomonadota bacterium]
ILVCSFGIGKTFLNLTIRTGIDRRFHTPLMILCGIAGVAAMAFFCLAFALRSDLVLAAAILAVLVAFRLLTITIDARERGHQRVLRFQAIFLIEKLVLCIGLICVGFTSLSSSGAVSLEAVCAVISVSLAIVCMGYFKAFPVQEGRFSWRISRRVYWETRARGLWNTGHSLTVFLMQKSDVFLIAFFFGSAVLGQYAVAASLLTIVSSLSTSFSHVAIPAMIRHRRVSDRASNAELLTCCVAVIGFLVLIWFGDQLIDIVFGNQYNDAYLLMSVFAPAMMVGSMRQVFEAKLIATNRFKPMMLQTGLVLLARYGVLALIYLVSGVGVWTLASLALAGQILSLALVLIERRRLAKKHSRSMETQSSHAETARQSERGFFCRFRLPREKLNIQL